ncbi:HlyD family type I secretion periplasmic adaptor subunit [Algimonas porphyrae]|uniref:Membrane fusion protein (MFP) family protein n=1 Tax=Algimonas porphyrae TaxID=1128113 RepID=A0ABQ5V117_9PROT|nr:HlyD family type I secretion periplasmic adaptor subunit [Algimonas porphyrae]GLQ21240.1 HlyD family type I secretion periplasmic adaptor subunit [Algimonas porphyrae]
MNAPLPAELGAALASAMASASTSAPTAPPQPSYQRYLRIGYIGVGLLVVGLFGWAALASIKGAVVAPGFVAVDGKPAVIQHLDGGVVGEIYVRDGAKVATGDPLIRLDPTEIDASREIIEVQFNETRARVERLKAERDGLRTILFPQDLLGAAASQPRVARAINGQRDLFAARRAASDGQRAQLRQRIDQSESQITGLSALIQATQDQLEKVLEERDDKQTILDKGFIGRPAVLALEREALRLQGDIQSRQSEVDRLRSQITETRAQIDQLSRDRQSEVLTELRQAETEASGFREQLIAASAQSDRIIITSPVNGVVHDLAITTTGGVVQQGADLMQIIPSDAALIILTQVQPADIDQVYPGQPATLRLSAFNARSTPELNGFVARVSPDRLVDPTTGFPYYEVEVDLLPDELNRLPDNLTLLPGMPAEAFMQTESRSVLEYLLKPATDAMRRAGREE